ncbi:MAG: M66 family metalloprotease, partial [Nannocystaceae bacterium]
EVEITVGSVQPNPYPDLPADEALGDALFDVGVLMEQTDMAPPDVYYYGLMQPAETRDDYDGLTGTSQELDHRAGFAMGAGFGDELSESTLVHELGHLHFLKHAPCGSPSNLDPAFPHADGMAHTEGYDVRTQSFLGADEGSDLMSYCQPRWISTYHYEKLASWVQVSQTW